MLQDNRTPAVVVATQKQRAESRKQARKMENLVTLFLLAEYLLPIFPKEVWMQLQVAAWTLLVLLRPALVLGMSLAQPDLCPRLALPPFSPALEVADLCLG